MKHHNGTISTLSTRGNQYHMSTVVPAAIVGARLRWKRTISNKDILMALLLLYLGELSSLITL